MAYALVPSNRLSYDVDGTAVTHYDNADSPTVLSLSQKQSLNDETSGPVLTFANPSTDKVSFVFPVAYNILGLFHSDAMAGSSSSDYRGHWQSSVDTTNGIDGTWVDVSPDTTTVTLARGITVPAYRDQIFSTTLTAVTGVRYIVGTGYFGNVALHTCHIYGAPTVSITSQNLEIWEDGTDARVSGSFFDWGDVLADSVVTKSFRVHNNSTLYTALSPTVSMEVLSDSTPSYMDMHTFSADGGVTWYPAVLLPNLGPGATSSVIQVRLFAPAAAQVGPWAARIKAAALAFV